MIVGQFLQKRRGNGKEEESFPQPFACPNPLSPKEICKKRNGDNGIFHYKSNTNRNIKKDRESTYLLYFSTYGYFLYQKR